MEQFRLTVASLNQTALDLDRNFVNILEAINKSIKFGSQLVLLPELAISGYGCEDLFLDEKFLAECWKYLKLIAKYSTKITIVVGLPVKTKIGILGCAAVLNNGKIVSLTAKSKLPNSGIFYEARQFTEFSFPNFKHEGISCGKFVHRIGNFKFGIEICEELWVEERAIKDLKGLDFILNLSASPFEINKYERRLSLIKESAIRLKTTYIYSNLVGNDAGRLIFDGHLIVASKNGILQESRNFSFNNQEYLTTDLDKCAKKYQGSYQVLALKKNVLIRHTLIKSSNKVTKNKFQSIISTLQLGLWDYLVKSRSKGFAISLSGGLDSAMVLYLALSSIKKAINELGLDLFNSKLNTKYLDHDAAIRGSIFCIYQATANSSNKTYRNAENLANFLGVNFDKWEIQPVINAYENMVKKTLKLNFNWLDDDLALQNIQSRVRSPGIWLLANKLNFLLLTTGNMSESAVGYCTMDGDTSGGLAPIGGIRKTLLRELAEYLVKKQDLVALIPILAAAPTAELRPVKQSDEEDLMPYKDLDRQIEDLILRKNNIKNKTKVVDLFQRSQWKRERLAPSFHIENFNLDPRSYLRMPILAGNLNKIFQGSPLKK